MDELSSDQKPLPPTKIRSDSSSPPPHPLDGKWFVYVDGDVYGPYTGHELISFKSEGRLTSQTQVLPEGSEDWISASEDRKLAQLFRAPAAPPPPQNISAAPGSTVVHVTNQITHPTMLMGGGELMGAKSPGVALLLSFLLCGAGQMYCGRVGKGFLMLIGCILLWFIFLGWVISIWSMVDAYYTAKEINLKHLASLQGRAN